MSGLNDLIVKLQRLSGEELQQRIMTEVASATHAACILCFTQKRDPYGAPWAPRKSGGDWPLLDKTGAMVESLTSRGYRDRVIMRIKGYAKFHQNGTRIMVARKMFPDAARGFGSWREPMQKAMMAAVRRAMK